MCEKKNILSWAMSFNYIICNLILIYYK
jgi:hypothetical protein